MALETKIDAKCTTLKKIPLDPPFAKGGMDLIWLPQRFRTGSAAMQRRLHEESNDKISLYI